MHDSGALSPLPAAQVSNMVRAHPTPAHNLQTLEGLLRVHVDCSDDLLEIPVPMLDRSILLYRRTSRHE